MSQMDPPRSISLRRAHDLCANGDWLSEFTVGQLMAGQAQLIIQKYSLDPIQVFQAKSHPIQWAIDEGFLANKEYYLVDVPPDDDRSVSLRIAPHYVVKVGPTLREGLWKGLGLITAVLLSSNLSTPLYLARIGVPLRELVKVILSAWEHVEDPQEQLVFEALFVCCGRLSVVNYDALKEEDYEAAYACVSPSIEDCEKELSGKLSRDQVLSALTSLKNREILREKDNRWTIRW